MKAVILAPVILMFDIARIGMQVAPVVIDRCRGLGLGWPAEKQLNELYAEPVLAHLRRYEEVKFVRALNRMIDKLSKEREK